MAAPLGSETGAADGVSVVRLPIVGVMGSGSEPHEHLAQPLGHWLAGERCHLLTGGGAGVMTAVSRAFARRRDRLGKVIGVLPGSRDPTQDPNRAGYPNPWVEVPIKTHLPLSGDDGTRSESRNHINILTSDLLIFLPGSAGTRSELELAVRYQRPALALLDDPSQLGTLPTAVTVVSTLEALATHVRRVLEKLQKA